MRGKEVWQVILLTCWLSQCCSQLNFTHHNLTEINLFLEDVQRRFPSITHLYSIGSSVQDRDLRVLVVGQSPRSHPKLIPQVALLGSTQGNAVVGCENLLHLINHLVTQYGQNETITDLVRTTHIHCLITSNPDGYVLAHLRKAGPNVSRCSDNFGRQNAKGVDLNRDYPDLFRPHATLRQPETKAVMRWFAGRPFVLAAYFYGAALSVAYPYQSSPSTTSVYSGSVDDDVYRYIAALYANTHHTMHLGKGCPSINFPTSFPGGITNGAQWYTIRGSLSDYAPGFLGIPIMGIGISCCKFPAANDLPRIWEENKDALIKYAQLAHTGVKGIVMTLEGQEVKDAWVTVIGREAHRTKTTFQGEFWRLLLPGTYTLQVTAHGYLPNIQQFGVDKDVVTQLEIILTQIIPNKDGSGPALLPLCQDQIILLDCPKDETEKREDFLRQVAELD